jgi:hypothetical protein
MCFVVQGTVHVLFWGVLTSSDGGLGCLLYNIV